MGAPTLRRRLASLFYEALVSAALVFVADLLFSLAAVAAPALSSHRSVLLALCFALLGGYFTYCWRNGQTLAMRAWKIRIESADGGALGWGSAFIRYVLAWVWLTPPLAVVAAAGLQSFGAKTLMGIAAAAVGGWVVVWALASRLRADGQFWHDALAHTRLVNA